MRFRQWLNTQINLKDRQGFDNDLFMKEMAIIEPKWLNKIQTSLQWVLDNKFDCVIIGGTAMAHYITSARQLSDVDYLTSDIDKIRMKAQEHGLNAQPLAMPDAQGIQIIDFDSDFIDAHSGNTALHAYCMKTAIPQRIGSGVFPIIAPEALVLLKLSLQYNKSGDDAFMLLKSGHVKKDKYLNAVKYLQSSLDDVESLFDYALLIPNQ